jgi:hypothetical protein
MAEIFDDIEDAEEEDPLGKVMKELLKNVASQENTGSGQKTSEMLDVMFKLQMLKKLSSTNGSGEGAYAGVSGAQSPKSIQQMTIDQGSWCYAWLLGSMTDPCMKEQFGGTEEELESITAYSKMIEEMQKKTQVNESKNTIDEEFGGDKAPQGQRYPPSKAELARRKEQSDKARADAGAPKK